MRNRNSIAVLGALCAACPLLLGWGREPHGEIVRAAISVLPKDGHIAQFLGQELRRLQMLVMLGDWRDTFIQVDENWDIQHLKVRESGVQFFSNDHLIFPATPRHYDHLLPAVRHTYRPFFERALQALRTESPANAARWLGSLLHFVTDTGSPPHAAEIRGEAHTRMENWLDGSKIDLAGYRPTLLGERDESAAAAFLSRMQGLIEFSKLRAERLKPIVEKGDRAATEPIALESATETAKVVADVLHTLSVLAGKPAQGCVLSAEVTAPALGAGMEVVPAKIVLLGTMYSTTSETLSTKSGYRGALTFRNLPQGRYKAVIYRLGARPVEEELNCGSPQAAIKRIWALQQYPEASNLVRNPDFLVRWSAKDRPEHWSYDERRGRWTSDNIRVAAGTRYRAGAVRNGTGRVALQWMRHHVFTLGEQIEIPADGIELVAPDDAIYARMLVVAMENPAAAVTRVHFVPVAQK